MKIGLIDVDGHHFPNLALMRISAYHKAKGDEVEWWLGDLWYYDKVYMSKIFSNEYSPDVEEPWNCGEVIKGGTGYAISLGEDGKEHFDKNKHRDLPEEVERMFPDYSIYPQFDFAVAMTSRGCPRGCAFCHVAAKEGRCSVKVADVKDFWNGQKHIEVLGLSSRDTGPRAVLGMAPHTARAALSSETHGRVPAGPRAALPLSHLTPFSPHVSPHCPTLTQVLP